MTYFLNFAERVLKTLSVDNVIMDFFGVWCGLLTKEV